MRRRYLYAAALAVAVIAGYMLGAVLPMHAPTRGGLEAQANVILQVYRNGQLVYVKQGDPAVNNLLKVLQNILDKSADGVSAIDIYGNSRSFGDYFEDYVGTIVIGDTPGVSRDTNTFSTIYATVLPDELTTSSNDTGVYFIVGGSYTLPTDHSAINVTAVGLAIADANTDSGTATAGYNPVLIFADMLSSPVTLNPGDTIHVRYIIQFP